MNQSASVGLADLGSGEASEPVSMGRQAGERAERKRGQWSQRDKLGSNDSVHW